MTGFCYILLLFKYLDWGYILYLLCIEFGKFNDCQATDLID